MTALARVAALAGACSLLWVIEGRRPFMAFGEHRARHVRPNLVLAGLTILTNVAFAAALPPIAPSADLDWPFWLQAVGGVTILDFFAWTAHFLLHKTAWGWRLRYFTAKYTTMPAISRPLIAPTNTMNTVEITWVATRSPRRRSRRSTPA